MKRVAIHRVAIALAAALFACAGASGQTVLRVLPSAPAGGDGLTWPTAFNDLQSALTAASSLTPPVQIWVAAGTYKPSVESEPGVPRTRTFSLVEGVSVYGGFAGVEGSLEERNIAANPTILSGDFNGNDLPGFVNRGDNAYHVVTAADLTEATAIDGLTVRGGHANGANPHGEGGGVRMPSGRLSVTSCLISDCYAGARGGGLYATDGATFRLTTFSTCYGGTFGGAVYAGNAKLLVCTFELNETSGHGGAAYVEHDGTLENVTFRSNGGTGAGTGGGSGQGGALWVGSNSRLVNCAFASNSAIDTGGAVFAAGGNLSLHGCTFFGNSAAFGGALTASSTTPIQVKNSIFWMNTAPLGPQAHAGGAGIVFRNCCIQGGLADISGTGMTQLFDVIDTDPLFVDPVGGDLRLRNGSPCIDRGHNDHIGSDVNDLDGDGDVLEPVPIDGAGMPRRVDVVAVPDAGDVGAFCCEVVDMGAHEAPDTGEPEIVVAWGNDSGSFHEPSNWIGGEVPGADDIASFDVGFAWTSFSMDAVTSALHVSGGAVELYLQQHLYDLIANTEPSLLVGGEPAGAPRLTIRDGTVSGAEAFVGRDPGVCGTLVVNGLLELAADLSIGEGGTGRLEVFGGAVSCRTLVIGGPADGHGDVAVTGELSAADSITVDHGTLDASGIVVPGTLGLSVLDRGALSGCGTIDGDVMNLGSIMPELMECDATLLITGDYDQLDDAGLASGSLSTEIAGTGVDQYSQFQVMGAATLGGGLVVETIGGFEPTTSDSFPILTAGSLLGAFDAVLLPALPGDKIMRVTYGAGAGPDGGEVIVVVDLLEEAIEIAPPQSLELAGASGVIAIADLDGSGVADLAVGVRGATQGDPGSVVIFTNDGAGGFTEVSPANPVGLEPADVDAGFLNGDAFPDLAVVNAADDTVSVLLGNGDGTFTAGAALPSAVPVPLGIAVADWSGDGLADIAVTNSAEDKVHFFRNAGGASFVFEMAVSVGERPGLIDPTDVDDDKNIDDVDFVVTNLDGDSVSLLVSRLVETGIPSFDEDQHAVGANPTGLAVRDLNLDGVADVVTSNADDGTISILLADGEGSFEPAIHFAIGPDSASVASGDLDLDGDFDLAVLASAGGPSAQWHVVRNDVDGGGQLAFTVDPVPPVDAPDAIRIASCDVNPSSADDIVTISGASGAGPMSPPGNVSLFVAAATPICHEDVDESGDVAFLDLLAVLAAWGPCAPCPADVDGDGTVGFADLLMVLAAWGRCSV
jgi:hypothetical protein